MSDEEFPGRYVCIDCEELFFTACFTDEEIEFWHVLIHGAEQADFEAISRLDDGIL